MGEQMLFLRKKNPEFEELLFKLDWTIEDVY
jgi:hypothetical protein